MPIAPVRIMETTMRPITILLAVLLIIIQYPLWLGKGGWLRVWELHRQLEAVQARNEEQRLKNAKLASEVQSLNEGTEAIEERARSELLIRRSLVRAQVEEPEFKRPMNFIGLFHFRNHHFFHHLTCPEKIRQETFFRSIHLRKRPVRPINRTNNIAYPFSDLPTQPFRKLLSISPRNFFAGKKEYLFAEPGLHHQA